MNWTLEEYDAGQIFLGQKINCDLFDFRGKALLVRGQKVTKEIIEFSRLEKMYIIRLGKLKQQQKQRDQIRNLAYYEEEFLDHYQNDFRIISGKRIMKAQKKLRVAFGNIERNPMMKKYLNLLRSHDKYTFVHSVNVSLLSIMIGEEMGLKDWELEYLAQGALLHDMGKLIIPQEIINSPKALSDQEMFLIHRHPWRGVEILKRFSFPKEVLVCLAQHHERWNGSGYPLRLEEQEISLFAQIVAVADVFDAFTYNRPYRSAIPPYHAVELIVNGQGQDFSEAAVLAFLSTLTFYGKGTVVTLDNGEKGIVVGVKQNMPTRPVINILWDQNGQNVLQSRIVDLGMDTKSYVISISDGVLKNEYTSLR